MRNVEKGAEGLPGPGSFKKKEAEIEGEEWEWIVAVPMLSRTTRGGGWRGPDTGPSSATDETFPCPRELAESSGASPMRVATNGRPPRSAEALHDAGCATDE